MDAVHLVYNVCWGVARKHANITERRVRGFRRAVWVEVCEFFGVDPNPKDPLAKSLRNITYSAIDCTEDRSITNKIRQARDAYFRKEKQITHHK